MAESHLVATLLSTGKCALVPCPDMAICIAYAHRVVLQGLCEFIYFTQRIVSALCAHPCTPDRTICFPIPIKSDIGLRLWCQQIFI